MLAIADPGALFEHARSAVVRRALEIHDHIRMIG
jgi:hypothetical protein